MADMSPDQKLQLMGMSNEQIAQGFTQLLLCVLECKDMEDKKEDEMEMKMPEELVYAPRETLDAVMLEDNSALEY